MNARAPLAPPAARIDWVDVAKGIGIVLMVHGHIHTHGFDLALISSFHMPLFFFLSGFVTPPGDGRPLTQLVLRLGRSLLIPYLIIGALGLIHQAISEWLTGVDFTRELGRNWSHLLLGMRGAGVVNGAIWFLPCLFATHCLALACFRLGRRHPALPLLLSLAGLAAGLVWARAVTRILPFNADVAPIAQVFLVGGQLIRLHAPLCLNRLRNWKILALIAVPLALAAAFVQPNTDMYGSQYGPFHLSLPVAVLGIAFTVGIAHALANNGLLQSIGRYSLGILGFHHWLVIPLVLLALPNSLCISPAATTGIILARDALTLSFSWLLTHALGKHLGLRRV